MDSSWFNNIGKVLDIGNSSGKKSSKKASSVWSSYRAGCNPIESMSKDFSQWEIASNANEDYENTLRAFEISQLNQKQRKPRTSNFIYLKPRVSLWHGMGNQMNVIQEDGWSSKSQDDEKDKSGSTLSGLADTKEGKMSSDE